MKLVYIGGGGGSGIVEYDKHNSYLILIFNVLHSEGEMTLAASANIGFHRGGVIIE